MTKTIGTWFGSFITGSSTGRSREQTRSIGLSRTATVLITFKQLIQSIGVVYNVRFITWLRWNASPIIRVIIYVFYTLSHPSVWPAWQLKICLKPSFLSHFRFAGKKIRLPLFLRHYFSLRQSHSSSRAIVVAKRHGQVNKKRWRGVG